MIAEVDGNGIHKDHGNLMLPVELRLSTGEGLSAELSSPQVCKVPLGAAVCKDVEEAYELPVNLAQGRHDTGQEGISSARSVGIGVMIPHHLDARRDLQDPV